MKQLFCKEYISSRAEEEEKKKVPRRPPPLLRTKAYVQLIAAYAPEEDEEEEEENSCFSPSLSLFLSLPLSRSLSTHTTHGAGGRIAGRIKTLVSLSQVELLCATHKDYSTPHSLYSSFCPQFSHLLRVSCVCVERERARDT